MRLAYTIVEPSTAARYNPHAEVTISDVPILVRYLKPRVDSAELGRSDATHYAE
jgi:hypothetical protein